MNQSSISANEIYQMLRHSPGRQGHTGSLALHAKRYERLFETVSSLVSSIDKSEVSILDVGPWWQTALFRTLSSVHVDTIGLGQTPPIIDQPRGSETYYQQDLNRAVYEEYRADIPPHDIVVMAEVIEHLPIAPTHMLRRIKRYVKPGGFLILTTPNAVSLNKRFKLMKGKVPYTLISEDPTYPSHFREYTVAELLAFASACGLTCVSHKTTDDWYWRYNPALNLQTGLQGVKHRLGIGLHKAIGGLLPESLEESIVMVLTY